MEYFRQRFTDELNDEGDVVIRGNTFTRHQVLHDMDKIAYDETFAEWVIQTKQDSQSRTEEFLRQNECIRRFNTLARLAQRQNVMPWVGAGMSASSGMPLWGNFLMECCADAPEYRQQVSDYINAGQFEEAAQFIADNLGQDILSEEIENTFGVRRPHVEGPVSLLPSLFTEGCVTTNFDYVLDQVYRDSEVGTFAHQIVGEQLRDAPRRYAENRHSIFRIHGEAQYRAGRVLTRDEYNAVYQNDVTLSDVLNGLVGTKNLLFLGNSLSFDRTLNALVEIKQNAAVENPRHYAFLPVVPPNQRRERRQQLNRADIHPIWYPDDGQHDQHIEDLLIALMDGPL